MNFTGEKMKKILAFVGLLFALTLPCFAQGLHRSGGVYVASVYNTWKSSVIAGPYGSGSVTITAYPGIVTLSDGYTFEPFTSSNPITIGVGASQETVTPSGVTYGTCPTGYGGPQPCAFITATYSNAHGQGDPIISGSAGVDEAQYDAGNYGGGLVYWEADSGAVTLSTSATTTTLCTSCIPQNALVMGVVARVTTAITGTCSGWELGDGTTANRFTASNTTLTAGTTSALDLQTTSGVASTTTGFLNITSAKSIINTCATGDPSAGAIHVHAFGYILATPNF